MRWKIIFVNGGIVMVLTLLTFFLLKTAVGNVVANPTEQRRKLERAIQSADAQLTLDALRMERWLERRTREEEVIDVFGAGTAAARQDAATSQANRMRDRAVGESQFARMAPVMVLFVDSDGVGIGRNASELMRGDPVGRAYPALQDVLRTGNTTSDIWANPKRQEQMFVSYAPVRDNEGEIVGAVVVGAPLNDERLTRTSEMTSGRSLALVVGESKTPIAQGGPDRNGFDAEPVKQMVAEAREGGLTFVGGTIAGNLFAAAPLQGYGAGKAVLVGSVPASQVANVDALLWPVFAVGALGLLLVLVGGVVLGNYISKPVGEIEEGLLLVMNGQTDLRFELEHDELGGLTSRINGLLNTVFGVDENGEETKD